MWIFRSYHPACDFRIIHKGHSGTPLPLPPILIRFKECTCGQTEQPYSEASKRGGQQRD